MTETTSGVNVHFTTRDFNGAAEYFAGYGEDLWLELSSVLANLQLQLQPSDQAGIVGRPIFDPKATNAALTSTAAEWGWRKVVVPPELQPFGKDWDGGKESVLAEWQFSNYPFLWNNIIRSEAVFQSGAVLRPLTRSVEALVIVTKTGSLPASNSTLYFEQAEAQIDTVTTLGVFEIPIRLVGLSVPPGISQLEGDWNLYSGRYARVPEAAPRTFDVSWGRAGQYGNLAARFS
ncbi:hypothetical protein NG702_20455 [Pseudarthrobacter sp. MDT3-28]|uniref:hypothetical protein n=1 Tax=Pseudarthrobacter raffinosi TaxID=2953651 RepID=UPI00208EE1A6|nr:hypothetical protein [Pseudarthrobacter sp. MDT3-28]MCO4239739.1 hypothetical protein [Pseudarthrobacter sp. MDT3-28]